MGKQACTDARCPRCGGHPSRSTRISGTDQGVATTHQAPEQEPIFGSAAVKAMYELTREQKIFQSQHEAKPSNASMTPEQSAIQLLIRAKRFRSVFVLLLAQSPFAVRVVTVVGIFALAWLHRAS